MCDLHQDYVIQPFIGESAGNDVRVIVIGGKVVAAMRRTAQEGEFRSNVHRGGQGHPIELQSDYTDTALRLQRRGVEYCGVDLLETLAGPMVLEVNPSPGFEEIETVTGIKVAEAMIAFAVEYSKAARKAN